MLQHLQCHCVALRLTRVQRSDIAYMVLVLHSTVPKPIYECVSAGLMLPVLWIPVQSCCVPTSKYIRTDKGSFL